MPFSSNRSRDNQEWKAFEVAFGSAAILKNIIELIQSAETEIQVEMYIFQEGAVGMQVLNELNLAVSRGVSVRLVVDGIGSPDWYESKLLNLAKFEVRIFHPVPWPYSRFRWRRLFAFRESLKNFLRLNRRNHKKLILVDQERAYVGSFNFMAGDPQWLEFGCFVRGEASQSLFVGFQSSWKRASAVAGVSKKEPRESLPKIIYDHPRVHQKGVSLRRTRWKKQFIRFLLRARTRVWIVTPYFNPNFRLLRGLISRSKRGVPVRIILSGSLDILISKWLSMVYWDSLLRAGVEIYLYRPQMLHAKAMVVDQTLRLGSSNWNLRSWNLDLELDVSTQLQAPLEEVVEKFEEMLQASTRVDRNFLDSISIYQRAISSLIYYLFRPIF